MSRRSKSKPAKPIILCTKFSIEDSLLEFLEEKGLVDMFIENTNKQKISPFFDNPSIKINMIYESFRPDATPQGNIFWQSITSVWVLKKYGYERSKI